MHPLTWKSFCKEVERAEVQLEQSKVLCGPGEDDRGIAFCYLKLLIPSNSSVQVRRNCGGSRSFLRWKLPIFLFLVFLVTSIRSYQCRFCPRWLGITGSNCQMGESLFSAPSYWEKQMEKKKSQNGSIFNLSLHRHLY